MFIWQLIGFERSLTVVSVGLVRLNEEFEDADEEYDDESDVMDEL